MVGLARWRRAAPTTLAMAIATGAAMAAAVIGLGSPATAAAQPGQRPAGPPAAPAITVTPLTGPDDRPMLAADHVNDDGLVTGTVRSGISLPGIPTETAAFRHGDTAGAIGTPGTTVLDVSESGQVVGRQVVAMSMAGFSWSDGAYTVLVDPPPGSDPNEPRPFFVTAAAVDEGGRVLGLRGDPTADAPLVEAAVWRDGEVVASTGWAAGYERAAIPADLNDRGLAVLNVPAGDGGTRVAALWRLGGRITRLGTLGGRQSWGVAIDERGRVAGVSETASGEQHAFLWRGGRMVDVGTLGGATSTVGEGSPVPEQVAEDVDDALNDRGEVAGTSETASGDAHAFLWRGGRMTDLGTLGGRTSHATALNNRGQVVGYSETASGEQHAFLWQQGRMIDLGALAGEGESEAADINDRGQIVGRAGDRAVMWTTVRAG